MDTPNYTFKSTEKGKITYGGSCNSTSNYTDAGINHSITLNRLNDGVYDDCFIRLTDEAGNLSEKLLIPELS